MTDKTRDDYALAIGKIALVWNAYHEVLGQIFCSIFTKSHGQTSLAIWHCLDSERTQRRLLRVAAETHLHWNKKGVCTKNLNTGVVVMKSAQDGA